MLPGTTADRFTVHRTPPGTDSEGRPHRTPIEVGAGRGTFGSMSARDIDQAARAGWAATAALTTPSRFTFKTGDQVRVRGGSYRVVVAKDLRVHQRVLLATDSTRG